MKPEWLKKKLNEAGVLAHSRSLRGLSLHTVCEEARCPNLTECFSKGVSTIMIMGDTCTRSCKFCAVKTGRPSPLDADEPLHVARMIQQMALKHVVITSVDRDDLKDMGSDHFAQTIKEVKNLNPTVRIEILTPDFQGKDALIHHVCDAKPDIFNHNLETVERLTPEVRSAAKYRRSLGVLKTVRDYSSGLLIKSGLMLGLGETREEIGQAMQDLRDSGCDLLTMGQYLQPSKNHLPVVEYIHPTVFEELKSQGLSLGFKGVFSGPFVRSSYMAESFFHEAQESHPV